MLSQLEECGVVGTEKILARLPRRIANDDEAVLYPCGKHIAGGSLGDSKELFQMAACDGRSIPEQFQRFALPRLGAFLKALNSQPVARR